MSEQFSLKFEASWSSVQDEVYKKTIKKPIFNTLKIETIKAAFRDWSNEDIFQFARFIHERYNFINIED